jgi:hypothetical protein
MPMNDTEIWGAVESRPIERRDDLIECFIYSLASHINNCLFIEP